MKESLIPRSLKKRYHYALGKDHNSRSRLLGVIIQDQLLAFPILAEHQIYIGRKDGLLQLLRYFTPNLLRSP